MKKRAHSSVDLDRPPEAASAPLRGGWPERSVPADQSRAQLVHSIYQLALDPHFYDTFLEQWDGHVDSQVAALTELKDRTALDDPELIAHFDRAFGILEELGRKAPDTLKEGRGPRLLLSADGTIIWRNRAAEQAFQLGSPAHLEEIADYFLDPDLVSRLLSDFALQARVDPDAFQLLRAEINDKPLFMLARAVHEQSSELSILLEPLVGEWNSEAGSLLARGFGLTEAEIEVAASLVEGSTPSEIASQREVSLSTVRSQIKALLAKTGAASQTDLVRLLASLSRVIETKDPAPGGRKKETYITPSRHQIPVEFHGSAQGTPVLFLHGMLDGISSTPRIESAFKKHRLRVIAPARPSFGTSTPWSGHVTTLPAAVAKDMEWLLNHLQIKEVQLLGHMAGSLYAFAVAAQLGERVKRIVNVAGGVPIVSKAQFKQMSPRQRLLGYTARYTPSVLPFVVRAGVRQLDSDGERALMKALYEASPADLEMVSDPDVFRSIRRGYRFTITQGHRAFSSDAYHIVRDWSALAAESTVPVTFIHGELDPVVKKYTVEDFARRLGSRAQVDFVKNCGQLVLFKDPDRVCRALLQ